MQGKKISDLDVYDDVNSDKSRKNLYEVSKNTGTYASPTYATNGSRKITQEQLREELNIKEYLVRDFIVVGSGGTIVEDKVNAIIVTANETFTLPTASISNYGKSIVIANRCDYTVTINGIVNGSSIKLTNFNEVIQLSCLFDGVSTYGWWLVSDAINDKICTNRVVLNTNTYTAKHNDSIKADALSIGSDVNITIPTASIEGRLIYVYYPTGSPTAYVVNLIGGFSATLVQLDYFLIRDNGTYWEAISTSQNVAVTPDLDAVTTVGSTTTNQITVGSATLINTTVSTLPFIDSAKKIISATGPLLGTWNQTLTAKTTPVDADTIVVNDSTASFESKKTTLLQFWSYILGKIGTALTTNTISIWNGTSFANSFLSQATDSTGLTYNNTSSNQVRLRGLSNFVERWSIFHNSSYTVISGLGGVVIGSNYESILGGYYWVKNGENQAYNNIHTFFNGGGGKLAELNSSGLSLGSSTINASAQLDLQSTTKGLGLNLVANGSKPTGRKANFLMNDTNSVLEFTTGTGASWQELAVYKFDELLQITDCLTTFATANTGVYHPFIPKCDMNVVKIFYNLQSAGTDTVRVAIYSDSSNTPTTLLVQSSESTTGATITGQRSITIASTRLLAGTRYWIAIKNDNGSSSFLSKNNVYSNNITRESFTSGAFVGSPAPSSSVNAVWVGIGI